LHAVLTALPELPLSGVRARPQAQDRCHRIGQTREVHIYRLVSERTIEENILHKSDQKRRLDHLAIQSGGFNTEHILAKFNPRELLGLKGARAPAPARGCLPGTARAADAPLCWPGSAVP